MHTQAPPSSSGISLRRFLSLHMVYKIVEDQLRNQGFGNNTLTLSKRSTNDLKILHDGLQAIMKGLGTLLKKYQSLTENRSISFVDRLRWGQERLAGFRERTLIHTYRPVYSVQYKFYVVYLSPLQISDHTSLRIIFCYLRWKIEMSIGFKYQL